MRRALAAAAFAAGAFLYASPAPAQAPTPPAVTNQAGATFLFKNGTPSSLRSNTTVTTVIPFLSLAHSLDAGSTPKAIVGDGRDVSVIVAAVADSAGHPVPDGQPVMFSTSHGLFGNGGDTTYAFCVHGVATIQIRSELVTQRIVVARVLATTPGANSRILVSETAVAFYPGAIRGSVIDASGKALPGLAVTACDPSNVESGRDTTDQAGAFLIPLRASALYSVGIQYVSRFTDPIQPSSHIQVNIPAVGGAPAVVLPVNISGYLLDGATGLPLRREGVHVFLRRTDSPGGIPGPGDTVTCASDMRGVFAAGDLSAGSYDVRVLDPHYSGATALRNIPAGSFVTAAEIGVAEAPQFEVIKHVNRSVAEIGDAVSYTVQIHNGDVTTPILGVSVFDDLPHAFLYAGKTARLDGVPLPEPPDRRTLAWRITDTLHAGETRTLTYAVQIGAGALEGDGINRAFAAGKDPAGDSLVSAVSSVQVTVRPGLFTDHGIVIGKVFNDLNENGIQDDGEAGIPAVELWMEDGTRILTGDDGKYSLPDVKPGQHVLRVNQHTLPTGSLLLAPRAELAGDGVSRFIRLTEGGIARTDFYVRPPRQASLITVYSTPSAVSIDEPVRATYTVQIHDPGKALTAALEDTLSPGFRFDLTSITVNGTAAPLGPGRSAGVRLIIGREGAIAPAVVCVKIYADSSAIGRRIAHRGRLVLSYPQRRDAVFVSQENHTAAGTAHDNAAAPPIGEAARPGRP